MSRTLLVITASADPELADRIAAGRSPRKDYLELARALDAAVLYREAVRAYPLTRLAARLGGVPLAQALLAFARRGEYDAVFTDAENIGLPLALLFKLARVRRRHVMLGHLLTTRWKRPFFRLLRVQSHIDAIVCHASRQRRLIERLGVPAGKVALLPYQVDVSFWRPRLGATRRQICSVGLEFRDYRTLLAAVRDLDVDVVIAAASYWSKRRDETRGEALPPNVRVTSLGYADLRELYAESRFVVVPVHDVEFQAGITTILEGMAMGKAVVVTQTRGQTDVVRGPAGLPPPAPGFPAPGFPDVPAEPDQTGRYVPPGDAAALRRAITDLLEHPEEAERLGANGRRLMERHMTLEQYVARLAALLRTSPPRPPLP